MRRVEDIPAGSGSTKLYLYVHDIVAALEVGGLLVERKCDMLTCGRQLKRTGARRRVRFSPKATRGYSSTSRIVRATILRSTSTNESFKSLPGWYSAKRRTDLLIAWRHAIM